MAEQGPSYEGLREPVLLAAKGLAGPRASKAKTAVDERLTELSKGTDSEKSLFERLTSEEDS